MLAPGERTLRKGLVFAAALAIDFICGTLQLAAGITLQVFTTGRGTLCGLTMTPVLRISSNTAPGDRWHALADLDAGRIATSRAAIAEVGREIFQLILAVAGGRKRVADDRPGLHNDLVLFNPGPVKPGSLVNFKGAHPSTPSAGT